MATKPGRIVQCLVPDSVECGKLVCSKLVFGDHVEAVCDGDVLERKVGGGLLDVEWGTLEVAFW